MYTSISNKIQQEIISNYFLSHCFSRIQYGNSFALESLVTVCQLWIWRQTLVYEKTCYIIFALDYRDCSKIYNIQKYLMNLNFQENTEATEMRWKIQNVILAMDYWPGTNTKWDGENGKCRYVTIGLVPKQMNGKDFEK
jgi:hypothetical protein